MITESDLFDIEEPERYRVPDVQTLSQLTLFSPKEVKRIYRSFKADCPHGVISEDEFKEIYSRFFPQQCNSSLYAHYVFNTFETDPDEKIIKFEEFLKWLSRVFRGTCEDRLRWVFRLYDLNHDGVISRDELMNVTVSVFALLGTSTSTSPSQQSEPSIDSKVDAVFQKMDSDRDGVVTWEEFSEFCLADPEIQGSMSMLTSPVC